MSHRTYLSDAIAALHGDLARKAVAGTAFSAAEMHELALSLAQMEIEAIRLEAIETAARSRQLAEKAVAALDRAAPTVDLDAIERMIRDEKVVIFPSRPRGGEARPA